MSCGSSSRWPGRSRARQAAPRLEPVALEPLIGAVVADHARLAEARGIDLGRDRRWTGAPRCAGDAEALRTLLANLVDNAVRYTPRGRPGGRLGRRGGRSALARGGRHGAGRPGGGAGAGLRPLLPAPRAAEPGTGLGLAIVQAIARPPRGRGRARRGRRAAACGCASVPSRPGRRPAPRGKRAPSGCLKAASLGSLRERRASRPAPRSQRSPTCQAPPDPPSWPPWPPSASSPRATPSLAHPSRGRRPSAAPPAARLDQPAPALAAVAGLPDFSAIVRRYGPAVVNVSTTGAAPAAAVASPFGQVDPDDPFWQFFRRFGGPTAGRGADPRPRLRLHRRPATASSSPTPTWWTAPARSASS